MSGFASLAASGTNQHGDGMQGASTLGEFRANTLSLPLRTAGDAFGEPSPPRHGFDEPLHQHPATTANPPEERSLEDLYRDYPDKQLQGLAEKDLELAVRVVLHITNEATFEWLNRWCPNIIWSDMISASRLGTHLVDFSHTYNVPEEATSYGCSVSGVAELFHECYKYHRQGPNLQVKDVVGITYRCALVCQALKDEERRALLDEANSDIKWVLLGLKCKENHAHGQAIEELKKLNQSFGDGERILPGLYSVAQRFERERKEKEILDRAIDSFQEHRDHFRLIFINRLQVLMNATGVFKA
ncbi:hypothetical protein F4810DRAFT_463778 [Camillea tinctor]|nr:hypothetical protein F4810DRAFT_463778 [Camillea tinctor]